ncbi:hypothetical protein QBC34DRAFT_443803 [Podospora aff. communis PSN243]|uniref:Uncharacterized protein n=1 Tax=Podospora aff. communis PSN243 TaxID=3040156 RepID=A0AAV9G3T0_9PEZI|nr:hypothetical protein QBC34DRAFT_443803 [Podospora aff. communis PSN243]
MPRLSSSEDDYSSSESGSDSDIEATPWDPATTFEVKEEQVKEEEEAARQTSFPRHTSSISTSQSAVNGYANADGYAGAEQDGDEDEIEDDSKDEIEDDSKVETEDDAMEVVNAAQPDEDNYSIHSALEQLLQKQRPDQQPQQSLQLHPSFAQQLAAQRQSAQVQPLQPAQPAQSIAQPQPAQVHPSFSQQQIPPGVPESIPYNAFHLFRRAFPHVIITDEARRCLTFRLLSTRDVKRIPVVRVKKFHGHKPQNIPSYFMQATGDVMEGDKSCHRCRIGGVYSLCVVMTDPELNRHTSGACAGCWYNRDGCRCTIRSATGRHRKRRDGYLPRPVGVEEIMSDLVPHVPAPAPVPAAATAYATVPVSAPAPVPSPVAVQAPTSTPAAAPTPAPVAAQPRIPMPAAQSPVKPESRDSKISSWEERYSKMPVQQLLEGQRHLLWRQDDINMRLVAMTKVLQSRVGSAEHRVTSGLNEMRK